MVASGSRIAILSCLALLAAACGGESPTGETAGDGPGKTIGVEATEFAFDPATITADPGETIELTFTNAGEVAHSFTIDDVVDVQAEGGDGATTTFTAPDSGVEFYCKFHPDQMRGELAVGESRMGGEGDTGGKTDRGYGY